MKTAPTKTKAPRVRRRWLRPRVVVLAILACVPIGLLAFWIVVGFLATNVLRDAEADADRLDPGWRFSDILAKRAVIPQDENSAHQVLAVLRSMTISFPRSPRVGRTPTGAPIGRRASDVLDRLDKIDPWDRLDTALAASLRRDLRTLDAAVIEGRKLAGMNRGRTDPRFAKLLWATLLGHVQDTRTVARVMLADAALRAHDGDADGAIESSRAILGTGRSIGDEPFMISQLVRISHLNLAMVAAVRAMNQGEPSDEALAKLQAELLEEVEVPLALMGLRGERAMIDNVFSQLALGEVTYREAMGTGGIAIEYPAAEVLVSASGAFIRYNHGLVLARMNEAIEIAKRPLAEQLPLWDEWEKKFTPSESMIGKIASSLSRETMPSVSSYNNAFLRIRAQMQATILLIAAERHRRAHGVFPDRIDAIDPKFLARTFVDPFSGRPIRYKSDGEGGLIVYSPGFDRTDNGGQLLNLRKWMSKGYDLGFRLRAVKQRSQPPALDNLPEDVFPFEPKRDDDGIEGP